MIKCLALDHLIFSWCRSPVADTQSKPTKYFLTISAKIGYRGLRPKGLGNGQCFCYQKNYFISLLPQLSLNFLSRFGENYFAKLVILLPMQMERGRKKRSKILLSEWLSFFSSVERNFINILLPIYISIWLYTHTHTHTHTHHFAEDEHMYKWYFIYLLEQHLKNTNFV